MNPFYALKSTFDSYFIINHYYKLHFINKIMIFNSLVLNFI